MKVLLSRYVAIGDNRMQKWSSNELESSEFLNVKDGDQIIGFEYKKNEKSKPIVITLDKWSIPSNKLGKMEDLDYVELKSKKEVEKQKKQKQMKEASDEKINDLDQMDSPIKPTAIKEDSKVLKAINISKTTVTGAVIGGLIGGLWANMNNKNLWMSIGIAGVAGGVVANMYFKNKK